MTGDARGRPPGWRILIVGTGGQGVLTTANLLTHFCVQRGHEVTSGQLHGMAQRGGSVQSSVMVDCGMSPAVPEGGADFVLGLEPVETVRALPFISSQSMVFMNTTPVIPFTLDLQRVHGKSEARYPELSELVASLRSITDGVFTVEATRLAQQAGSVKAINMVLLGCWLGSGLSPFPPKDFEDAVWKGAPAGSWAVSRKAFRSGVRLGKTVIEVQGLP